MDLKLMLSTFGLVFLAELGDKTQLATFCMSADSGLRLPVFLGSAGALVLASLIATLVGCEISRFVPEHYIKIGAGVLFVVMGAWLLFTATTPDPT